MHPAVWQDWAWLSQRGRCLRSDSLLCCAGACLKPPKHCWLLCEYLPGGTLMAWLYGDKNK